MADEQDKDKKLIELTNSLSEELGTESTTPVISKQDQGVAENSNDAKSESPPAPSNEPTSVITRTMEATHLNETPDIQDEATSVVARLRGLFGSILNVRHNLKDQTEGMIQWFGSLSRRQRINFALFAVASCLSVIVLGQLLTGNYFMIIPESPLLRSLESVASRIELIKPDEPTELFDNPLRNPEYVVLFTKSFVNLKPSAQSGRNPMAAFEIFIEANSQEAAIELKDRERQFKDVIHRVFEGMPYDEIRTQKGKEKLKLIVRRELNQQMNKGRVKKVYFKTLFHKP